MHIRSLLAAIAAAALVVSPAHATLTTTNSKVSFVSNGVTVAFATGFRFLDNSHLVVQKVDLSSVTTTLGLGTDYTVTGANAAAGGTVTLNVAITSGWTLKIARSTPKTQTCSFRLAVGSPNGKAVEDCLDRLEMQAQEMNDGTFTQLLATPVTTAQATVAAPIAVPNSSNTNVAGSSSAFAAADHAHQCATASATQVGCVTTGTQTWAGNKTLSGVTTLGMPLLSASTAAGQSIPTGATDTIVVFGTVETDTDSAYVAGTGRFTVPAGKGGHYQVTCVIAYNTAPGGSCAISVFKNAVILKGTVYSAPGAQTTMLVTATTNYTAGDVIDCRTHHGNVGSQNLWAAAPQNYLAIKQIPF